MSKGLTPAQKAILIRAYKSGGLADKVPPVRGMSLERRGYGNYNYGLRCFFNNTAGDNYAANGVQIGVI